MDDSENVPPSADTDEVPLRRVVVPAVVSPPPDDPAELPLARRAEPPPRKRSKIREAPKRQQYPSILPLMLSVGVFAAMMAVSFAHGVYGMFSEADLDTPVETIREQLIRETAIFELTDTIIVIIGLLICGRPAIYKAAGDRVLAWAIAIPGFAVLLGMNLGYSLALRTLVEAITNEKAINELITIGLSTAGWRAIMLICVQPAFIEELFFRHLLLGHLRTHLGMHAAVWISSVVFGMAHLGNIAAWPILILLGAGLGYARVYSGGLALPILLHFLHNLAVLGVDEILV